MSEPKYRTPIDRARETLTSGVTCAVVKGKEVIISERRGIAPVVLWLDEDPNRLRGAYVADRVVGKAAALLFVYAGVGGVYAKVMSQLAVSTLKLHAIPYRAEKVVEYIENREKTGRCPMETRAQTMHSPQEAFEVFREIILNNESNKKG